MNTRVNDMGLTATKSDWLRMLNSVNAFVREAKIETDGKKATCLAIDPAHVAILKSSIDCEGDTVTFTVNVEQFIKALNAAGGDPYIEFDDYISTITVNGNAKVKLPILDDMGEIKDIKRQMFQDPHATGKITTDAIEPIVSYGLYAKEQVVVFVIKDGKTKIVVGQDRHSAEFSDFEGDGEASSKYPLDYFDTAIKQMKGAESIDIILPDNDYPLCLKWDIGTGHYNLVIAPRIEEE